jgi:hypothetical protein
MRLPSPAHSDWPCHQAGIRRRTTSWQRRLRDPCCSSAPATSPAPAKERQRAQIVGPRHSSGRTVLSRASGTGKRPISSPFRASRSRLTKRRGTGQSWSRLPTDAGPSAATWNSALSTASIRFPPRRRCTGGTRSTHASAARTRPRQRRPFVKSSESDSSSPLRGRVGGPPWMRVRDLSKGSVGLQTRDIEPATSAPGVDQLLGRQARPRAQVGEVTLHGAGSDAHALGCSLDRPARGDIGGEDVHLALCLRRTRREFAAHVAVGVHGTCRKIATNSAEAICVSRA